MKFYVRLPLALALLALAGCETTSIGDYRPLATDPPSPDLPRKLVVVIDGTANDQTSRTNAARLYELAANQNRKDLSVFYTEGVGTDLRVAGAITGWGIGEDVRRAYRFIAERWEPATMTRPASEIYLVGFSRGAYAARMLAGMLFSAGIADLSGFKDRKERVRFVERLYARHRLSRGKNEKARAQHERRLAAIGALPGYVRRDVAPVQVEAMALWDTVEALAMPDRNDAMAEENGRHVDQLCNVKRAFHALALDDNRAYSFTPLSLLSGNRRAWCDREDTRPLESIVDEVWFAGAHADVGGSYSTRDGALDGYLPGVSMNWMLARLADYRIVPPNSGQYADALGPVHNAKDALIVYKAMHRWYRDPLGFMRSGEVKAYYGNKPRLHMSVADRFKVADTLDAAYRERCLGKTKDTPLLCQPQIRAMTFWTSLIENNCIVKEDGGTGYVFVDRRQPTGSGDIDTRCVTLVPYVKPVS